ncbi:MAG: DUF2807 domain-containing protein [Bacteroidota bacterium]
MNSIHLKIGTLLLSILQITISAAQTILEPKETSYSIYQEWIIAEYFDRVSISDGITLHVLTGENQKVQVQANEGLLKCITMEVSEGLLQINAPCNKRGSNEILVQIKLPTIRYIKASKKSRIYALNSIKNKNLNLKSLHHSNIYITAEVENLQLESSYYAGIYINGSTKNCKTKSKWGGIIDVQDLTIGFDYDTYKEGEVSTRGNHPF